MNQFQKNCKDLIYICRSAANNKNLSYDRISEMDLNAIYNISSHHMLTATVAYALEKAGIKDEHFRAAQAKAIRRAVIFETAWKNIAAKLEENKIWYMPLKGAIIKDYYPSFGIREMSDYDILFDADRADRVREIMEELGFSTETLGRGIHDCYHKPPVLNFEMHTCLYPSWIDQEKHHYYRDVKVRLQQKQGYEFRFTPEDLYIYLVAHEYKHYASGGTGLRSLLDTYLFLKKEKLDWGYIRSECKKLGIEEFEAMNRSLTMHLFSAGKMSVEEKEMLKYILTSGTYGTFSNMVENGISQKGRLGFFFSKLTLPFPLLAGDYPILRAHPNLYLLISLWRLIHGFFFKHDQFMYQVKAIFTKQSKSTVNKRSRT